MIQFKRGKTREWIAKMNHMEKLAPGQPGYDTDRRKMKIGDGKKTWIELPYAGGLNAEEILDSEENAKKRFSAFDKLLAGLGNLIGLDFSNDKVAVITYGADAPDNNTVGKLYLQHYDVEPETDYITECGYNNNWYFQKYKSGFARCCGSFVISTPLLEQFENIPLFHNSVNFTAVKYPFTFKEPPTECATLQSNSGLAWLSSNSCNTTDNSAVYKIISPDKQETSVEYTLAFLVQGYWK